MSQANVEVVRRMSKSFNEAGYSARATLDFFDADGQIPGNPRALCRTRTGDPFLTMEVLYQLS